MKRICVLILISITLLCAGCETFHGLGQDVENAGEWIQQKTD